MFSVATYECKAKLFNSHCNSFYGAEFMDISSSQFQKLLVKWRKSARFFLDIPYRTHNWLLPYILNSSSAKIQIFKRILCFVKKGLKHDSHYISFFFRHCVLNFNSYICKNVNIICRKIGIKSTELHNISLNKLKLLIHNLEPQSDWRCFVIQTFLFKISLRSTD